MKIRDAYEKLGFDRESEDVQIVMQQPGPKGGRPVGIEVKWDHPVLDKQIQTRIGSRDMPKVLAVDGKATYAAIQDGTSGRVRIWRVPHRLDDYIGTNAKPFRIVAG